jgi:2'-hydroxyisoflavone reductase
MNVLVIDGTRFIGRTNVEEPVRRGHTVTVYHQGRHEIEFPDPRDVGPGPLP